MTDTRPLRPLRCLLCDAEAVVVIEAPNGCTCARNVYQPRCRQHLERASDSGEIFAVVERLYEGGEKP